MTGCGIEQLPVSSECPLKFATAAVVGMVTASSRPATCTVAAAAFSGFVVDEFPQPRKLGIMTFTPAQSAL